MADDIHAAMTTADEPQTVADDAADRWDRALDLAFTFSRGQIECDCDRDGTDCTTCGGTGFHPGIEPLHTLGRRAGMAVGTTEDALHEIADVVACARVTDEKHAAGVAWPERIAPEARPFLAELERLAPYIARAAVLLRRIDEANGAIEKDDPRELARAALLARARGGDAE